MNTSRFRPSPATPGSDEDRAKSPAASQAAERPPIRPAMANSNHKVAVAAAQAADQKTNCGSLTNHK